MGAPPSAVPAFRGRARGARPHESPALSSHIPTQSRHYPWTVHRTRACGGGPKTSRGVLTRRPRHRSAVRFRDSRDDACRVSAGARGEPQGLPRAILVGRTDPEAGRAEDFERRMRPSTRGENAMIPASVIQELKGGFRGELIAPGDPQYDAARTVFNASIDRKPSLIARCAGREDVVRAVKIARKENLLVAVRGTGHNVAGYAVCDGGLVIDLSSMKGIAVNSDARTVRVEG